ncbi:hypothetical protein ON010_g6870 [Phytophthora cinnamomi]|nr:hypothetical protein ON010_g6870 [Phytophthora cinnamomi]
MIVFINAIPSQISGYHEKKFASFYNSIAIRMKVLDEAYPSIMEGVSPENKARNRKEDPVLNTYLMKKETIKRDLNHILDQTPVVGYNTGRLYSSLRCSHISDDEYWRAQFVWNHYGMKTIEDYLIWYNNLDVVPFIKAIQKQRELLKGFDLGMFCDGVSLPGLSEKVMYQTQELIFPDYKLGKPFDFPDKRYSGNIKRLDKYICAYCCISLNEENVSADRINNKVGHVDGNIIMRFVSCNCARKDMNIKAFRHKKLLDFNADRLVFSIDEGESDIYTKMRANIAGGPSIIFNRLAKRNETVIRGGKICKKVIGYDANALYLWCLGNEISCRRLTSTEAYDGIIDDIISNKVFGFLECEIETLEHFKDYFSEMTPIFKNVEIEPTEEVIGKHMFDYNQSRGKDMAKKSRNLIGSYFAFEPFMKAVSDARREGDADSSKAMIADMMKLLGNAAFGRSGMDKSKHREIESLSDEKSIYNATKHFIFSSKEMDTDSGYIAFSAENLFPDLVKPELHNHYKEHKYDWFPPHDTTENAAYDRRTPGLFKEVFRCNAMVSLSSKNYVCYLSDEIDKQAKKPKIKMSAKGIQKKKNSDVLTPENFESVAKNRLTFKEQTGVSEFLRKLKNLYYDPETGFISAPALYKKAKEIDSSITFKLGEVMEDDLEHNRELSERMEYELAIGPTVLYSLAKGTFDKEKARWSKTIYEIVGIDGYRVQFRSKNGHTLYKGPNDIKLFESKATNAPSGKNQVYEVEKLLDHKKLKSGKYKYLVKWKDYDEPTQVTPRFQESPKIPSGILSVNAKQVWSQFEASLQSSDVWLEEQSRIH